MRAPVFETPARLGWRLNYGEIIFYPDAPAVICSMTPVFPGCSDKLAERGIVWDIEAFRQWLEPAGRAFALPMLGSVLTYVQKCPVLEVGGWSW